MGSDRNRLEPEARVLPAANVNRTRLPGFMVISGLGWLLDLGILTALVALGVSVFQSNLISAATAVSVVFVLAQRRTFTHDGPLIFRKFGLYLAYNAAAILAASVAIATLQSWLATPVGEISALFRFEMREIDADRIAASIIAKLMVTPITLYANFLFMGWLLEGRASFH